MRAGRLNKRITFQRQVQSLDAFREDIGSWTDIVTVAAGVEPISGSELFSADQVQSDVTTRIVCRYSSDVSGITLKDRIHFAQKSKLYDIRSIINVNERNKELQFMCTEHSIQ